VAAAADFYGKVVGWDARKSDMSGIDYTIFYVPGFEMGVAGVMPLVEEVKARGVPSNWTGYIEVDDVDAKAEEFTAKGGMVHRAPDNIPGVGRFAVVADPHGAVICLFKPNMPDAPMPPAPAPTSPGTVGWNELHAGNGAEAFEFYSSIFGWQKDMAVDMGPLGVYQTFKLGDRAIGGIMTKMAQMPMACWTYYFTVPSIRKAAAIVTGNGGKLLMDPHQVPGGSWIFPAIDPQGAMFAITSGSE